MEAKRGREMTPRRVLERFSSTEDRLLADDSIAADFIDLTVSVLDDPVPREKLNGVLTLVRDGDGNK